MSQTWRTHWTEWLIALRFLLENRQQSLLIILGIAVGSAVIVFITALITGLQANVVERTLGSQAHIRILPPDEFNRLAPLADGSQLLLRESPRAQRLRSISNWQALLALLDQHPQVRAVSPVVSGPALARRGVARTSVALLGVDLARYLRIIPLQRHMRAGTLRLAADQALIGRTARRGTGLGHRRQAAPGRGGRA